MHTDLASTSSASADPLPHIRSVLELGDGRIQELLSAIGWSYWAIWLQTSARWLGWHVGNVNTLDDLDDPSALVRKAQLLACLEQYKYCSFPLGVGMASAAILSRRPQWLSGAALLQSPVPQQAQFFRDASIQTAVCIPYEGGVLELGNTDPVPENEELISLVRLVLSQDDAGSASLDVNPGYVRAASLVEAGNVSLPLRPQDARKEDQTASPRTATTRSEFFVTTMSRPTFSVPLMDYGVDVLGQLNFDMDIASGTAATSTGNVAIKYKTSVVTSTLGTLLWRTQEASTESEDDPSRLLALGYERRRGSQAFEPEPELPSPAGDIQAATETARFPSDRTREASALPTSAAASTMSAFTPWTSSSARLGKEKVCLPSLLKRCLRYVIPRLIDSALKSAGLRTRSGSASDELPGQDKAARIQHKMAERKRRGRQNTCFKTLRTLIPDLKKKDKVALLENTIHYIKSLNARIEELEEQNNQLQHIISTQQTAGTAEGAPGLASARPVEVPESAAALSGTSQIHRIEVKYDPLEQPPVFQIEMDISVQESVGENMLWKVLAALVKLKLLCVHVDATIETGNFKAKLSVKSEEMSSSIPTSEFVQEMLRDLLKDSS